jgi:hypothetical protein
VPPAHERLSGNLATGLSPGEILDIEGGRIASTAVTAARQAPQSLVPYHLTLDALCIKKSHQISAGMIVAWVRRSAAAVAARPALVR